MNDKPKYTASTPKEVEIKAVAPFWLRVQREWEKQNPFNVEEYVRSRYNPNIRPGDVYYRTKDDLRREGLQMRQKAVDAVVKKELMDQDFYAHSTGQKAEAERVFRHKFGTTPHKYRYDTDPDYKAAMDRRGREAREVIRPQTSVPYNAAWMFPNLSGSSKQTMTTSTNDLIGSALPIPFIDDLGRVPGLVKGLGLMKEGIGAGIRKAGASVNEYLTTSTPLRNAWKYNPNRFVPTYGKYYRGIGRGGYTDAMESGIIQTSSDFERNGVPVTFEFSEAESYAVDPTRYAGSPFDDNWKRINPQDRRRYVAEIDPIVNRYPGVTFRMNPPERVLNRSVDASDANFYVQDWWRRYRRLDNPHDVSVNPPERKISPKALEDDYEIDNFAGEHGVGADGDVEEILNGLSDVENESQMSFAQLLDPNYSKEMGWTGKTEGDEIEFIQKVLSVPKEKFHQTVVVPGGEIAEHADLGRAGQVFGSLRDEGRLKEIPLDEWADRFLSNLPRANELLAKRNKTNPRVDYRIKSLDLSPHGGHSANIVFETPSMGFAGEPGTRSINVILRPGEFKGTVPDIKSRGFYEQFPGINMYNTSNGIFPDGRPRKGTGMYEGINDYLTEMGLGKVKTGFSGHSQIAKKVWGKFVEDGRGLGYYANAKGDIYGMLKALFPLGVGTSLLKDGKEK